MGRDGNGKERALADIAVDTLKGDIADWLIGMVKDITTPWAKMKEREQRETIEQVKRLAFALTERAVTISATRGFPHFPATVGQFKIDAKLGIVGVFAVPNTDEALLALNRHRFQQVLLIAHDMLAFLGERAPILPDVIGDLRVPEPTTGPGAPSDEKAMQQLGRGKSKVPPVGDAFPPPPEPDTPAASV